ncbi:MAG: iron chelate uptake ABC transporter family permease subunit [Propionicimonas sp.]
MTGIEVDFGRRMLRPQVGPWSSLLEWRAIVVTAGLCTLIAAAVLVSVANGDYPIPVTQLVHALTTGEDAFLRTVVVEWRLPRALAAALFGGALALSGATFQRLTGNPLASPDVIGFATGAYTGALIVLTVLGGSFAAVTAGALTSGVATAGVVLLLTAGRGGFGVRLIVVGIAVSAMLSGVNAWLLKTAGREQALSATVWGAGSLSAITLAEVAWSVTALLIVALAVMWQLPALQQLELGDETAAAQGVRVGRTKTGLIVCSVALMAIVTAVTGPITFIALVAPPIAARLTGSPGSAGAVVATGALLLSIADLVARFALPTELPVGLVTLVIGGGYLGWLLLRPERRFR